jgi:hypothetical protein
MYQEVQLYLSTSLKSENFSCHKQVSDLVNNMLIILTRIILRNEKKNHQNYKISHIPSITPQLQGLALKLF